MEWIGKLLLVFFMILGMAEACRLLIFWLLRPHRAKGCAVVMVLKGREEEAEYLLRAAAERLRWMGGKGPHRLICVDRGMDEETKEICRRMQVEIPFLEICPAGELESRLSEDTP